MLDDVFNPHKKVHNKCNLASADERQHLLDWMSSDETKKAFHVPDKVKQPYNSTNRDTLTSYKSVWEGSAWIYEIFQKLGYKTMHMMGDTDGILSLPGAWQWIRKLKFKVTKPWTPWLTE
jgi:hypothetical protein